MNKFNYEVCSLELAQKLKQLGVNRESLYEYLYIPRLCEWEVNLRINNCPLGFSAFTAHELGKMLPNNIMIIDIGEPFDNYKLYINKFNSVNEDRSINNNYIVNYECDSTSATGAEAWLRRRLTGNIYDPNLANAMAKMLIYLIENKLMEIQDGR